MGARHIYCSSHYRQRGNERQNYNKIKNTSFACVELSGVIKKLTDFQPVELMNECFFSNSNVRLLHDSLAR